MSYSRSRGRLEEALTIVREFLEKGSASYRGRIFNQPEVSLEMRPVQETGCPSTWRPLAPER